MAKQRKKASPQKQQITSVDKLIKERARNLDLDKCYISAVWKETSECNVVITRKHSNGNYTVGLYLVDLLALGVRDSFYYFNETEQRLEDLLGSFQEGELEEVDYIKAHNIIFAALEWADDWNFKPCNEFAVSQYILEEDDDHVPLMDIEVGYEGKPAVIVTEERAMMQEIEHLKREAGIGNFTIIDLREEDDIDIEDPLLPGWEDDVDAMGVAQWDDNKWKEILQEEKPSFRAIQFLADTKFFEKFEEEIGLEYNPFEDLLGKDVQLEDDIFEEDEEVDKVLTEADRLAENDHKAAQKLLDENAEEYAESELFQFVQFNLQLQDMEEDKVFSFTENKYKKHPDSLTYKLLYASECMYQEKYDLIPAIFDNKWKLKEIYPTRTKYDFMRLNMYASIMCEYFMKQNDLLKANPYYDMLDMLEELSVESKITMEQNIIMKLIILGYIER